MGGGGKIGGGREDIYPREQEMPFFNAGLRIWSASYSAIECDDPNAVPCCRGKTLEGEGEGEGVELYSGKQGLRAITAADRAREI